MKGAPVLRFVLRPFGIFWCLSVPLRVYSQRLLVEILLLFPTLLLLFLGRCGVTTCVLRNTSHTRLQYNLSDNGELLWLTRSLIQSSNDA